MEHPENVPDCPLYQDPTYSEDYVKIRSSFFSVMFLTDRLTNKQTNRDENMSFIVRWR